MILTEKASGNLRSLAAGDDIGSNSRNPESLASITAVTQIPPVLRTQTMPTAPEPFLSAGLDTVHFALVCCRNWTLDENASVKQVNDLMEAIHEVPRMLMNWQAHSLDELRTHLDCFHVKEWREFMGEDAATVPDLVQRFDRRVSEFEHQL